MSRRASSLEFEGVNVGFLPNQENKMPAVITPKEDKSKSFLMAFMAKNRQQLLDLMTQYKVVLFRGFQLESAVDFEDSILQVEPNLGNDYHGTSPRNMVAPTKYVFTASELPEFFPIPQHLEMSFLPSRPKKLFFFCRTEPTTGGETPITDFSAMLSDLDPNVLKKFKSKGVTYYRNYTGPQAKSWDPFQLKSWPEVYSSTDRSVVERGAAKDGLKVEWKANSGLRLTNHMPATHVHPITQQEVWSNHCQVFHPAMAFQEYYRIARHQRRWVFLLYALVGLLLFLVNKLLRRQQDLPMNTVYGDGSVIPLADITNVRNAIWKNTVFNRWQRGDIYMIDNAAASHGRMPYTGKQRSILVAWG